MRTSMKTALFAGIAAVAAAGGIGAYIVLTQNNGGPPQETAATYAEAPAYAEAAEEAGTDYSEEFIEEPEAPPAETTAAETTAPSEEELEAIKAEYEQHLLEVVLNDPENAYDPEAPVRYKFDDIGGDGIPELIYSLRPQDGNVCPVAVDTYVNNRVMPVYAYDYMRGSSPNEYSFGSGGTIDYYPGSGLICGKESYGESGRDIRLWKLLDAMSTLFCCIEYDYEIADQAGAIDHEHEDAPIPEKMPEEAVYEVYKWGWTGYTFSEGYDYLQEMTQGYEKAVFDYFDEDNLDFNELLNRNDIQSI